MIFVVAWVCLELYPSPFSFAVMSMSMCASYEHVAVQSWHVERQDDVVYSARVTTTVHDTHLAGFQLSNVIIYISLYRRLSLESRLHAAQCVAVVGVRLEERHCRNVFAGSAGALPPSSMS